MGSKGLVPVSTTFQTITSLPTHPTPRHSTVLNKTFPSFLPSPLFQHTPIHSTALSVSFADVRFTFTPLILSSLHIPNGSSDPSLMMAPLSCSSFPPVLHNRPYQRLWYVLSCLWDCAYKRFLAKISQ